MVLKRDKRKKDILKEEISKAPMLRKVRHIALLGAFLSWPVFLLVEYALFRFFDDSLPTMLSYGVGLLFMLLFVYSVRILLRWHKPIIGLHIEPNNLSEVCTHIQNARRSIRLLCGCLSDEIFCDDGVVKAFCEAIEKGVDITVVWGTDIEARRYPDGSNYPKILTQEWSKGIKFYQLSQHPKKHILLIDRHIYRYTDSKCNHDVTTGKLLDKNVENKLDGVLVFNEELGYLWSRRIYHKYRKKATEIT